jgi:hypothetical protein
VGAPASTSIAAPAEISIATPQEKYCAVLTSKVFQLTAKVRFPGPAGARRGGASPLPREHYISHSHFAPCQVRLATSQHQLPPQPPMPAAPAPGLPPS